METHLKTITGVHDAPQPHWVGDGFPVRSLFSYHAHGELLSPFLLLDYAGPAEFPPATRPRGVGSHPHRGFETVTIVYQGEVDHRDSSGGGGSIGPGDVQWMTAAAGIVHDEFHSESFTRAGGTLEMVQLWINLPARDKLAAPGYQALLDRDIPSVALPHEAGRVRVIAGEFGGERGPAHTYTSLNVWDVRLQRDGVAHFRFEAGRTLALAVLHGTVLVNDRSIARDAQLVVFGKDGESIGIEANTDSTLLLLEGEAIDEPIVGYGPFVMNSESEIRQAINDFNSGRLG